MTPPVTPTLTCHTHREDSLETPTPDDGPTVLLTVEEAARQLRVGRTTMYALLRQGDIPSVRIGQLRRVRADSLREYVNQLTQQAA